MACPPGGGGSRLAFQLNPRIYAPYSHFRTLIVNVSSVSVLRADDDLRASCFERYVAMPAGQSVTGRRRGLRSRQPSRMKHLGRHCYSGSYLTALGTTGISQARYAVDHLLPETQLLTRSSVCGGEMGNELIGYGSGRSDGLF